MGILLSALGNPLARRKTRKGLEGAEERGLVGEPGLRRYEGELLIGMVAKDLLGLADAVAVDPRRERAVVMRPDTIGHLTGRNAEPLRHIAQLQFAVQVELLRLHQLTKLLIDLLSVFLLELFVSLTP